jgi:hypothetical protein
MITSNTALIRPCPKSEGKRPRCIPRQTRAAGIGEYYPIRSNRGVFVPYSADAQLCAELSTRLDFRAGISRLASIV